MKKQFEWYLKPSTEEINEIWKNGVLSVDANVLLDLYRYNEKTRNSLIEALIKFKGGKWITFQACTEFFRNRNKVIVSSEKTFKEALDEIQKLSKSLETATAQLRGNILSPEIRTQKAV